jgi:hypothetical protein
MPFINVHAIPGSRQVHCRQAKQNVGEELHYEKDAKRMWVNERNA